MTKFHSNEESFKHKNLYNRIDVSSLACFFVIGLISFATPYYKEYPEIILGLVLIKLFGIIFRRIIFYHFKTGKGSETSIARLEYLAAMSLYSAALIWSLFCITTIILYGLALPTLIVLISAIGISSSAIFILSSDYVKARTFACLIILPFSIWCFFSDHEKAPVIAILFCVYLIVILKNMGGYNNWFHAKQTALSYLNKEAVILTEMNEKLRSEILYRESAEKALRVSEERYRTLFQNNPIETIIVDHNGVITGLNSAKKMAKGRVPQIGEIMYKDYGAKHENDMYAELMDSMKNSCKKEFPEQKYQEQFLFIKFSPFSGGAIITSLDITEQKNAEKHIQALTREIMTVQEKERKRISRDLHDSVAQELSTLRISCETFFDDISLEDTESVSKKINTISKVLHSSISTVRDIAYELRPPCLDEFGLGTTLYRYCEDFSAKTGIKIDFFSAGFDNLKINSEIEINLYRLIQESLSNIKKHAHARNVIIRLVASFPKIILRIEDNGQGFEMALQKKAINKNKKMGLRGMNERINLLGGNLKIKSKVGKGTNIVIEVPMVKKVNEAEYDNLSLVINA